MPLDPRDAAAINALDDIRLLRAAARVAVRGAQLAGTEPDPRALRILAAEAQDGPGR